MELETTLFNKEGFNFARVRKNQYKLTFNMENKNIFLYFFNTIGIRVYR
jgi:hypothetical protein